MLCRKGRIVVPNPKIPFPAYREKGISLQSSPGDRSVNTIIPEVLPAL
jgi:hypothetical protein